jgi:hypothetical protein
MSKANQLVSPLLSKGDVERGAARRRSGQLDFNRLAQVAKAVQR